MTPFRGSSAFILPLFLLLVAGCTSQRSRSPAHGGAGARGPALAPPPPVATQSSFAPFAPWPGATCSTPLDRAIATHGEWIGTQIGRLPGLGSTFPFPLPPPPATRPPRTTDDVPPRAKELWLRINTYRYRHGLNPIDLSPALSLVAETHVRDLETAPQRPGCNGHSWTDRGAWTPCCYTDDHAQAACMWRKPREIASFDANGYEISIGSPGVVGGAPLDGHRAVQLWSSSPAHDDVMLERGVWANRRWKALGVSISDSHASAWFADVAED